MHALFGCSPDPVSVAGGATLRIVNQPYLALFGYDDEAEVLGRPFIDMVAPSSHDFVLELARRRRMGEPVPSCYIVRGLRRDGTELDVEIRSTTIEIEGQVHVVALHREVKDRQGLVLRSDDDSFYRALFDVNTAIKLLIAPTTGLIVDANLPAVEFYGWPLEVLRTMRITDINTLSPEEVRREMENACTGRRRYFRFRHRIASGEVRHVEVHSGPVSVGDEQLLLSIIHDVTERDALEQQLRASQRLEAVGRLAGGIAHEFNNLLTVVLASSEMMVRKAASDSPVRPYVDDLSHAARRAAELTRELLAFSRRQVMQPQALDLNDIVSDMGGLLQRTLGSKVDIELDLADEDLEARVDPRQLEHVLMNLVLNARDAMPSGGTVTITTRATAVHAADATIVPPGRWATISVRDDGEGMDAETQARIFEPFFTTRSDGGTGLGLATVYGIVTQSGGHLTVESTPGEGTELTAYLPFAPSGTSQTPPSSSRRQPRRVGTVLLVEDIEPVRRALARGLEAAGYVVLVAGCAEEALRAWAAAPRVDALVTDIVMPGRSGIDLVLDLLAERPELPVVVISGDLRGHDLSRLPEGVRALQKPLTAARVVEELDRLIRA
jgi:two-component system, cell cycle sensor histidine kinase and response regulator CckA